MIILCRKRGNGCVLEGALSRAHFQIRHQVLDSVSNSAVGAAHGYPSLHSHYARLGTSLAGRQQKECGSEITRPRPIPQYPCTTQLEGKSAQRTWAPGKSGENSHSLPATSRFTANHTILEREFWIARGPRSLVTIRKGCLLWYAKIVGLSICMYVLSAVYLPGVSPACNPCTLTQGGSSPRRRSYHFEPERRVMLKAVMSSLLEVTNC